MLQRILVIKLRHHGDVLLTTALYKALVDQFPGCAVDTLIYRETTPLLVENPHVRERLTIDRKLKGLQRLKAELGLLLKVRRTRYDAVIHMTDQWSGALMTAFSKAPIRVEYVYAKRDRTLWHRCFNHQVHLPPRGQKHAVELNLLCLRALGVDPNTVQGELVLPIQAKATEAVQSRLTDEQVQGPFVLIHPAARWPFKCWQDEQFAEVVAHLIRQGLNVVLTCSPDPVEIEMTARIESLAQKRLANQPVSARLVNWGGQVTLPMVAALLKLCRFYVGVDSAPMHMAAALHVPQVALFGPSWVQEWRPWSAKAQVIWAGDYGALPHPDSINTDDPTRLLRAIPTEVVTQAVDRLMVETQATA